ncbi:MAG: cell division protein FtsA [Mailhella sp.]|nr:cell division protein FtsA [Mailhella sp.]
MSQLPILVGLDIGTTKICAVAAEVNDDGSTNIIGMGSSPSLGMRKGMVVNIEQTVESIRQAISECERMADCNLHSVYVGIAGSHIKGFSSHGLVPIRGGGEISVHDVERVMEAATSVSIPGDRVLLHSLPQEYIVDGQGGILNPVGMSGVRLEVDAHLVTGAETSVRNITRACEKCGLHVEELILEGLASSKAVLTDEERELGVALIDIGGGTCDIAVFTENAIKYTGTVALGGQNVTNDLSLGLQTPLSEAEKIKTMYGCVLSEMVDANEEIPVPSVGGRPARRLTRGRLTEICGFRMEEILLLVDKELEKSGYKSLLGAGVVLTGGCSLLLGVEEMASEVFGLPTRVGYPINMEDGVDDMVNNPIYATAIGLIKWGVEKLSQPGEIDQPELVETPSFWERLIDKIKNWFSAIR